MTFIVAEMSASHNGSIDTAIDIIEAAKMAGADAVKLQTFEPDELCADKDYIMTSGAWEGQKLIDLYRKCHTPKEWHERLFGYAQSIGISIFSTPFQPSDVDFLETIDCPFYKIASFEITHLQLINRAALTGKPMIISTGMASKREIDKAVSTVFDHHKNLTLLHCVSEYPAKLANTNLRTMTEIESLFGCAYGLSDHSTTIQVPVMAATLGATIIEKHIALDREGPDGGFALLPYEFKDMVESVRAVNKILGDVVIGQTTEYSVLKPSLYYAKNIKEGDTLDRDCFVVARPFNGVHPNKMIDYLGIKARHDCKKGAPVDPL